MPNDALKPHWLIIQETVAAEFGVSRLDLISDRRSQREVMPRHIAMYLTRRLTTHSLPFISRQFGRRDHTTVLRAIQKIDYRRKVKAELHDLLERLETNLEPLLVDLPDPEIVDVLIAKAVRKRLKQLLAYPDSQLIDTLFSKEGLP